MEYSDFEKLHQKTQVTNAILGMLELSGPAMINNITEAMIEGAAKSVISETNVRNCDYTEVLPEIVGRRFGVATNLLQRLENLDYDEVLEHILLKNTGANIIIVATVVGGVKNKILDGEDYTNLAVKGNPSKSHYWMRLGQLIYRCDGTEKKKLEVKEALIETIVRDMLVLLEQNEKHD